MRQHFADPGNAGLDRAPEAGDLLNVHGLEEGPGFDAVGFQQEIDLIDLAAEPDQQHVGVDVGIGGQLFRPEGLGDHAGCCGRAVDRGQDADVIACPDPAGGAAIALEVALLGGRAGAVGIDAELIVVPGVAELQIVAVDMFAGGDLLLDKADGLSIFGHWLAGSDGPRRDLVAARYQALDGDAPGRLADLERAGGDDDIVGGIETDARTQWSLLTGRRW